MDGPRVTALLIEVARFFRFSVLGFSLLLPLIGAAAVSQSLAGAQLAALAAVGLAFHIFAYVSNDVCDLAIDRTQPLRAGSPLVRGLVQPRMALAIALSAVPLALLIHAWTGGPSRAAAALLAGVAFMLLYNLRGKRFRVPLLSDAVQGLGWVALALYGALATGEPLTETAAWLAATIFVYVLLINGLHGGLRDLHNDARHGARTTALYLGARTDADGHPVVPPLLAGYGLALQILLLVLALSCVLRTWPAANRIPLPAMVTAIAGSHLVLWWLGRAALRAASNPPEMIRAGMTHLFLSIGVVCLPFAFFANAFATAVVVAMYAVPLLILIVRLTLHDRRMASRVAATLALVALLPALHASAQQTVRIVPRDEIVRAMRVQKDLGYNLCATANGARFNAGVLLDLARNRHDPQRSPFVLTHDDYFAAFAAVAGCNPVPTFIQIAHDRHEDQYVDYRRERVIASLHGVPEPFAMNVVTGWIGAPASYSYEDRAGNPALRVTHSRVTSYRLADFGGLLLFDDIHGLSGRALDGLLGLVFKVIGDARAIRSFIAVAADGTQVTRSTGRKGLLTVSPYATVDRAGRGEKDVPGRNDLQALKSRIENTAGAIDIRYVPIQPEDILRATRLTAP